MPGRVKFFELLGATPWTEAQRKQLPERIKLFSALAVRIAGQREKAVEWYTAAVRRNEKWPKMARARLVEEGSNAYDVARYSPEQVIFPTPV